MSKHSLLQLQEWMRAIVQNANFSVRPILFSDSSEWTYVGGKLTHQSGLFFNLVGVSWHNGVQLVHQPLIEQREIGTLGFLLHDNGRTKSILVQAKIEPGNVNICQLSPTFQATASNAARVHGGKAPILKKWFLPTGDNILYQSLNSEQGTRFLGKLNRNTMVKSRKKLYPSKSHKWIEVDDLLDMLDTNHLVNTDARSVLTCSPWEELVTRQPFTRYNNWFAEQLRDSYLTVRKDWPQRVINNLSKLRQKFNDPQEVPLEKIPGWQMRGHALKSKGKRPFVVRQIHVTTRMREVPSWDQPIIDSASKGVAEIYCGTKKGKLYFLLAPQIEMGLLNRVELGPSLLVEPGAHAQQVKMRGKVIAAVYQSDEGGRFFQDITRYRIVHIGEIAPTGKNDYWLTLGEISSLLRAGGFLTNEARSTLSLLLKWL
jgi:dTDP-4-dehydro-6-deoxy-alpha-D-glucopyranose 2,3-dehydratase